MMTESEATKIFKVWFGLSTTITLVVHQYFELNKDALELELNAACVLLQNQLYLGGWEITGTAMEPQLTRIKAKDLRDSKL